MEVEGKGAEDPADFAASLGDELLHGLDGGATVGALEVGELDDGEGGVVGAARGGGSGNDGGLDCFGENWARGFCGGSDGSGVRFFRDRVVDGGVEGLLGLEAYEDPAIEKDGGRGVDGERVAFLHISIELRGDHG